MPGSTEDEHKGHHGMIGKIFKAYDVRATYPDPLNEDAVLRVGYAAGQFLTRNSGRPRGKVVVSRDMRPSSPALTEALITGLRAGGASVVDVGMCDTSFVYFAINHLDAIGGIQVTASHNPIEYNGLKISGMQARPIGARSGLLEIQDLAEKLPDKLPESMLTPAGSLEQADLWDAYRDHVLRFLDPPKRKLKVFIDACNGMAGKLVPKVFDGVENLEIIDLNFEITGSFVHEPNPLVAENMAPTQEGVKQHGADLGVCFDGDADRCILTDEQGQVIGCDHLTALFCEHFLRDQDQHAAVVYDLRSSKVVEEQVRKLGGSPHRSRVGHVFMKAALRETQGVFGGELSGHFYFRDNFCTDSGAIAFAVTLSMLGQGDAPISELIAPFRRYPQSGEINFRNPDAQATFDQIKKKYAGAAEIDELDGVTVDAWEANAGLFGGDGDDDAGGFWFNVRASNTEPLLRLNAEAKDRPTLDALLAHLKPMLGEQVVGH